MRGGDRGTVYDVNPEVLKLLERQGIPTLDMRQHDVLTDDKYADAYHLNEVGRRHYSEILAAELLELVRKLPKH
jgi:hypothetical protein